MLNGEALVLNSRICRLEASDNAVPVDPEETTPVATLCEFTPDYTWEFERLHFLYADESFGEHVHELVVDSATVQVDILTNLNLLVVE